MAFSSTRLRRTVFGNLRVEIWSFNSAGVTTGTIVTGVKNIQHVDVTDSTGMRAAMAEDHTTTAGSVVLSGLTSNDLGTIMVFGK